MGICAANMKKCDKKAKCIFGPNEGKAYDPKDPCCGQGTFNAGTCDCDLPEGYWVVYVEQLGYRLPGPNDPDGCPYGYTLLVVTREQLLDGAYLEFQTPIGNVPEFTPNFEEDGHQAVEVGVDAFYQVLPKGQDVCTGTTFGCDVVLYSGAGEVIDRVGAAICQCPIGTPVPCQGCNATLTWEFRAN